MPNQTPNIGEQWRYVWEGEEGKFTLYTVDVDADDEGRTKDFGQEIASGYWEGGEEGLWALTATPVMLTALQIVQKHLAGFRYDPPNPEHDHALRVVEQAIQEATTDPNTIIDLDDEPPDNEPDGAVVNLEPEEYDAGS